MVTKSVTPAITAISQSQFELKLNLKLDTYFDTTPLLDQINLFTPQLTEFQNGILKQPELSIL